VLAEYSVRFGERGQPYALYGYEAMSVVLAAIRAAGLAGNEREAVIRNFFATRDRSSVLGRYSIEPDGDTTLSTYAVDRVSRGRPVFWRELDAAPAGV
jgi:branched-chain amino acid transport system substrate-binding protein